MLISLALTSRKESKSLSHGDSVILKVLSNLNDPMACFGSNADLTRYCEMGSFFQMGDSYPKDVKPNSYMLIVEQARHELLL